MDDLLRDAIANLQTCFSGSENTQELLLRVKSIYQNYISSQLKRRSIAEYIRPLVISYHVARPLFHWMGIYQILLPRSNVHKLITKTILRIDTIKEISCNTFCG